MEDKIKFAVDNVPSRINTGECVLFLGPGLFRSKNNGSINREFAISLWEEIKAANIPFDDTQKGNIYYTVERYINGKNKLAEFSVETDISVKKKFKTFARSNAVYGDIYEQLSKLPFYLVINTNPDNYFLELCQKNSPLKESKYNFWYYDNTKVNNELTAKPKLPDEIDAANPVMYNVFGYFGDDSTDSKQSLILKEYEFVNYSRNINLANNGIPDVIKNFINNNKLGLFLGFDYDSWHMKILLKALGFPKPTPNNSILLDDAAGPISNMHFFEDEMKFLFVKNEPAAFVKELSIKYDGIFAGEQEPVQQQGRKTVNIVFISDLSGDADSLKDTGLRERIAKQLSYLERNGIINQWSEDKTQTGSDRIAEKNLKYQDADIFIVVVGVNFWASENQTDFERVLKIIKEKQAVVLVPIHARFAPVPTIDGLDNAAWLPAERGENGKLIPVLDGTESQQDKKIMDICDHIIKLIHKRSNA